MKDKFVIKKTKIKIIGIGGGGSSIVAELAKRLGKVSFIAANTDSQALKNMPWKVNRFKFGQELTQGLGTGMDPELGKLAAENAKQKIKRILNNQDLCIFIVCLGGGTGSGAAPIFTEVSHHPGRINLGIFTMPFKFEGERRNQIARDSLEKLKPNLNGFLVIPNQKMFKIINKTVSLNQSFSLLNKILANNLASFIELIYKPGLINIDFADFKTILEGKGERIYFNTAEANGSNRAEEAVKNVLRSPLFDFNANTAKRILFNISAFPDLKMREVEQISNTFSDLNRQSKIIFGVSQASPSQKSEIKVALLVTGDSKKKEIIKLKKIVKPKEKVSEPTKPLLVKKITKPKIRIKKIKETGKKSSFAEAKKALVVKSRSRSDRGSSTKSGKAKKSPPSPRLRRVNKKKKVKIEITFKKKVKKIKKKREKKRLNALEVKKVAQKEEARRWAEEEKWDVPAFLRRSPWKEKIKAFRQKK